MRYFFLFCILHLFLFPQKVLAKHAVVEISLAQSNYNAKTKELQFDLLLRAVDKPFYLSFSDVVLALPKSGIDMAAVGFELVPGSTQLFNLGEARLSFPGIRTKIKASKDTVYFIIQLMPNQFTDMSDFFEQSVQVNTTAGKNRVGRFSLKGILQIPAVLQPHFASRGPGSLILAFDPKNEFRAVELTEKWLITRPAVEILNLFEVQLTQEQLMVNWKWHSSKQLWKLWASVDGQNWTLIKEGKGGEGIKGAAKPISGEGMYSVYRLSYINEKGIEESIYRYPNY